MVAPTGITNPATRGSTPLLCSRQCSVIGIVAELKLKMTSDVNEKSPKLYNFFLGTRELELILNNCFGESAVYCFSLSKSSSCILKI